MGLYAPMQYVLEGEWETLPVEEKSAGYRVTWKEHATLLNGRECHTVYAGRKGENDYTDDINARSNVINYLSGSSVYNPQQSGLGVPLEMTMALHSDAGCSKTDELIGSLGIYTTDFNNGKLNAGTDRYASRDLADILLTQIQKDIYSSYSLPWTRRSMWNRNYSETRLPATPSTIIELLSHQNFADMQLGQIRTSSLQWGVPFTKVFCSSLPTSTIKNTLFSLCL